MKKILCIVWAVVILVCITTTASASAIIDPTLGKSGTFRWEDGLGQIDSIDFNSSDVDWSISVSEDSYMTYATAYDLYAVGDTFALYVDGSNVPWSTEYNDSTGNYHGELNDLLLTAGSHTLTLFVTGLATGYEDGQGMYDFSATRAVPEPTTMLLFGAGLVGIAGFGRKKFKK